MRSINLKYDNQAAFDAKNPVLKAQQLAYAHDTKTLKIGDGVKAWAALEDLLLNNKAEAFKNVGFIPAGLTGPYCIEINEPCMIMKVTQIKNANTGIVVKSVEKMIYISDFSKVYNLNVATNVGMYKKAVSGDFLRCAWFSQPPIKTTLKQIDYIYIEIFPASINGVAGDFNIQVTNTTEQFINY